MQTVQVESVPAKSEKNAGNGVENSVKALETDKTAALASATRQPREKLKKRGRPFEPGNTAWRGTDSELLSAGAKRRHLLRNTMLEAVTPAKAQQCVKRMLEIINAKGSGSDKKAAVGAFKVLFDLLGAKAVDVDAQGPRGFVFILPAAGTIPDVRRIVDNEAEGDEG